MAHDPDRRRLLAAALGGSAALTGAWLPGSSQAAIGGLPSNVGHADSSPQWELLRGKLFGERPIAAGAASQVQIIVPLRAAYGASVPVKIVSKIAQTPERQVRRMTLLVDKNPSPIAATRTLGTALGQADFETRLRVDEYSHVRVVSELSDGTLHMDSRYVKVSGGCSAPPNRDTPELIGRTTLRLPEGLHPGRPTPLELTVLHPNDTGFEMNQRTLLYVPAHFVRRIRLQLGGRLLLEAETDFSISENPHWRLFFLPPERAEELSAEVEDSREQRFQARLSLPRA